MDRISHSFAFYFADFLKFRLKCVQNVDGNMANVKGKSGDIFFFYNNASLILQIVNNVKHKYVNKNTAAQLLFGDCNSNQRSDL